MAETLHQQLARWVAAGLLSPAQATRVEQAEVVKRMEPTRTSLAVEALGYLGGLLAAIAGFIAVRELWPDIPRGVEIGFASAGAVVLFSAGVVVPSERDAALERLRSVLWLLSAACVAATVALLTAEVWNFASPSVALTTAVVAGAYATALWFSTRAALQHVAMFAGTVGGCCSVRRQQ